MTTPRATIWDIEAHTVIKHRILENYLQAWFPILNKYNGRILYLDGFAGPGRYSKGERGSPIVALETALHHRKKMGGELFFVFIDKREDRIENLKCEIAELNLPECFKVHTEVGEFQEVVGKNLDLLESAGKNLAPTFAFIDPFGFSGLPFNLVARILQYPRSEVMITFMVDAINRFLANRDPMTPRHIVELFGTEEVLDVLEYSGDRVLALRQLYQRQLEKVAKFLRFFEMRNKDDRVIYYLFFATNNELGHLRMKEAMWRVDGEGDFRFSDSTNPTQTVLFHQDHSAAVFDILQRRFQGSKKPVAELLRLIRNETPYIDKHLKDSLRFAVAEALIDVDEAKLDGQKRKKGTFPDNAVVSFTKPR